MGLVQPVEVRALEGYRIWLRYDDGVEGEVDLSHMLDSELFQIWKDRAVFQWGLYTLVTLEREKERSGTYVRFCPNPSFHMISVDDTCRRSLRCAADSVHCSAGTTSTLPFLLSQL